VEFSLLFSVKSENNGIGVASDILKLAQERAEFRMNSILEKESEELNSVMQSGFSGMFPGGAKALKEFEKDRKTITNRVIKDEIDGFLLDYTTFFRDWLARGGPIINSDLKTQVVEVTSKLNESSLNSLISTLNHSRDLLTTNVSKSLILESFFTQYSGYSSSFEFPIPLVKLNP